MDLDDLFVILCGFLGAASFWSTALAEIVAVGLLVVAGLRSIAGARGEGHPLGPLPRACRLALILCGVYGAATIISIVGAPLPVASAAGLVWHPFLFPAALSVRLNRRMLGRAAKVFLLSGAASALVTILLNLLRDAPGPVYTFTGLTTFADLLVLAGIVASSLLFPAGAAGKRDWSYIAPGIVIPIVLVWCGQRAPALALGTVGSVRVAEAGPRPLLGWFLVVAACLLLGPSTLGDKMVGLLRGDPVDRYVVWGEGLSQIPGTPLFGHGPGSYAQVLPSGAWGRFVNRPPSSWHNDVLETWLDSGPIAALAFGGILLLGVSLALRGALAGWKKVGAGPGREAGLLFLCLASFGVVGSVVTTSVLGCAFWIVLGLTLNPSPEVSLSTRSLRFS